MASGQMSGIHQKRSVASEFDRPVDYHVWDALLEAYHKLHPKPKSITELKEALQLASDLGQPATVTHQQGC